MTTRRKKSIGRKIARRKHKATTRRRKRRRARGSARSRAIKRLKTAKRRKKHYMLMSRRKSQIGDHIWRQARSRKSKANFHIWISKQPWFQEWNPTKLTEAQWNPGEGNIEDLMKGMRRMSLKKRSRIKSRSIS